MVTVNPLDSALSGLRMAQQQLGVISANISNVQTDGYTRKILPQSTRTIEGVSIGVKPDTIIRKVDYSLVRDMWDQIAQTSALDIKATYLGRIQDFHGPSQSETSFAAEISQLKDSFSALSDEPENIYLQNAVIQQADVFSRKMNDFSEMIQELRNDADEQMVQGVTRVNSLLEQIAEQNQQVLINQNKGLGSAENEDLRDKAVKELAQYIDITFFTRGDGAMVVQTKSGVQLADELPSTLWMEGTTLGTDKYYPTSASGIFLGGDPDENDASFDLIPYNIGGKLGALAELRDEILPSYQAQADELAYRTAQRFDNEGLALYTDENGQIPSDTAPTTTPLSPVEYVGFSRTIQVNQNIIDDSTLLYNGTEGDTLQAGSNEVVRRIIEFAFGNINYQSVEGSRDIRVSVNPAGDTLQENMGLYSSNRIVGTKDLTQYTTDVTSATGNPYTTSTDQFTIRIYDTRVPADSGTVTIDMSTVVTAFPVGSGGIDNVAEQIAAYINSLSPATFPASMDVVASVNTYGQLSIATRGNVTIANGTMGTTGLSYLGLTSGSYETTDPYFDIQVGNLPSNRITIEPGDIVSNLTTKIDATEGIATSDIVVNASGYLSFRPQRGGDIRITGGSFTSVAGFSTAGGNDIIKEIFGNSDPIADIAHAAFRTTLLGPGTTNDTHVSGASTLIDYAQRSISAQSVDHTNAVSQYADEEQYRATLEKQVLDQSGVNVDEELSNMIIVQTAYAAAARAITAANDMMKELLDSFR
jgi:flagellar hook-associated protein 1 FlgK